MLSVITSYFARPDALDRFLAEISPVKDSMDIEFIISEHKSDKLSFSTGKLHNTAVKQAKGDVILKQDIDCTFTNYKKLYDYVKEKQTLVNVGVTYNNCKVPYGNEFAMPRYQWPSEPEWVGYGWEDYALIAKWMVQNGEKQVLRLVMKGIPLLHCTNVFRDGIARKKNAQSQFSMFHHDHIRDITGATDNRILFYNLIQELIA